MRMPFSPFLTLRPSWFHAYSPATRVASGLCRAISKMKDINQLACPYGMYRWRKGGAGCAVGRYRGRAGSKIGVVHVVSGGQEG
jgi:hypothetical protein